MGVHSGTEFLSLKEYLVNVESRCWSHLLETQLVYSQSFSKVSTVCPPSPELTMPNLERAVKEMLAVSRSFEAARPFRLVPNCYLVTHEWRQVRFPKSKRRRIRRKWAKRPWNFRSVVCPMPTILNDHRGNLIAHPEIIRKIEAKLDALKIEALEGVHHGL